MGVWLHVLIRGIQRLEPLSPGVKSTQFSSTQSRSESHSSSFSHLFVRWVRRVPYGTLDVAHAIIVRETLDAEPNPSTAEELALKTWVFLTIKTLSTDAFVLSCA